MTEARTAGGRLRPMPSSDSGYVLRAAGCTLYRAKSSRSTYVLDTRGFRLSWQDVTVFQARADTAEVLGVTRHGRGDEEEQLPAPPEQHLKALRELGFKEMVLRGDERYELRRWRHIRRIPHDQASK